MHGQTQANTKKATCRAAEEESDLGCIAHCEPLVLHHGLACCFEAIIIVFVLVLAPISSKVITARLHHRCCNNLIRQIAIAKQNFERKDTLHITKLHRVSLCLFLVQSLFCNKSK